MIRMLVHGTGELASQYIDLLTKQSNVQITAIIDDNPREPGNTLAGNLHIPISKSFCRLRHLFVNYIVFPNENGELLHQLKHGQQIDTPIMTGRNLLYNDLMPYSNLDVILQTIDDGIVVIDDKEIIQYINRAACDTLKTSSVQALGSGVHDIIKNSGLTNTLQTRQREINKRIRLKDGQEIITSRIPIINQDNHLIGAFAYFKEVSDVQLSAEENTDLNFIKATLGTLIKATHDAICIINNEGYVLHVNHAYEKLVKSNHITGKHITACPTVHAALQLDVLKTRRAVHNKQMLYDTKDVIIDVEPIIVDGKLKGCVAVFRDESNTQELGKNLDFAKHLIRNLEDNYRFDDIVYVSPKMSLAMEQAKIAAHSSASMLLKGEFGTGKGLFARAIHNSSDLRHNKFIQVNCNVNSDGELEKLLFGYFDTTKKLEIKGYFDEANHGTIYLNHINYLSKSSQEKLFHFLQHKTIIRVNGMKQIPLNVRVITSTMANLDQLVFKKSFQEGLYYELSQLSILIPALVERKEDLPLLISHLLRNFNHRLGRNVQSISNEAEQILHTYNWPGNVKELENVIHTAFIKMKPDDNEIRLTHLQHLHPIKQDEDEEMLASGLHEMMADFEMKYIQKIYKQNNYNKTQTAKVLNISVRNLYYKLEKLQID